MIMTSTSQAGFSEKIHVGDLLQFGLIWCIYGEHMGFLWVLYGSLSICSITDSQRHFLCEHAPCGLNLSRDCIRIKPFSWRDCRSRLKLLVLFGCFRTCIPKSSIAQFMKRSSSIQVCRAASPRNEAAWRLALTHTVKTREIRCAILNPEMSR